MFYDRIEKYQNVSIKTYCDDDLGSNTPWCYFISVSKPSGLPQPTILSQGYVSRESALMAAKTEINVRF